MTTHSKDSRAPLPAAEKHRLAALRAALAGDRSPQEKYDAVVRFIRSELDVPMAMISVVEEERQWFKSSIGTDLNETPRDVSFCSHTILEDDFLLVPDALADRRFATNPLVKGTPGIRFYLGVPLRLPDGLAIGALCVMDTLPRTADRLDQVVMKTLGDFVVELLIAKRSG